MSDKEFFTPKQDQASSVGHFKTPLPYSTPRTYESSRDMYATPLTREEITSDSDESTASGPSNVGGASSDGELSIVAEFDDLMRCMRQRRCSEVEDVFLEMAEQLQELQTLWQNAVQECLRLRAVLDEKTQNNSDLEYKLSLARKLLDEQKKHTRRAEDEKRELEDQLEQVRELLIKDKRTHISEEAKEKLSFLQGNINRGDFEFNAAAVQPQLSTIQEVNTTGSLLSDFSYSRSEDDLDASLLQNAKAWKKHRPSAVDAGPALKKRKSADAKVVEISTSETVRATTTLTVLKGGPITATSVIESVPAETGRCSTTSASEDLYRPSAPPAEEVFNKWHDDENHNRNSKGLNIRAHDFQTKTVVVPSPCGICEKRIGFGKSVAKCNVCRTICHLECKKHVPLPCVPAVNTPTMPNGVLGYIRDYAPNEPPMVPAIIVHCVNEIESKGLNEVGLYRVPGSEKEVRKLRERFLKRQGIPNLGDVDINVLCGTVKDFLRSLNEPLIPHALWHEFVRAAEIKDEKERNTRLYEAIADLPQPNRDTLAFMVVHLKKVAESKACRMPVDNLAKVFGPTIVGYSSEDLTRDALLTQTTQQTIVMEHLLKLPTAFWLTHIDVAPQKGAGKLQQTPTAFVGVEKGGGFFTPHGRFIKRKQRFFATPPSQRK